jgi:hypothetical protein
MAGFTAQISRLGVSPTERAAIYDRYAATPDYGAVLRRTGGLRKGRIAGDATGKSGGYRVFSFFANLDHPVFLLWIIDKRADATLTDAQERQFKAAIALLKAECS